MADNKDYFGGMTNNAPPAVDSSMKPPGGSVNDSPTRTGVGPQPKPPGPRTA